MYSLPRPMREFELKCRTSSCPISRHYGSKAVLGAALRTAHHLVVALLIAAGCTPGGVDTRFWSVPIERLVVDGIPVDVRILQLDERTYDIEATEGRFITVENQPLVAKERYRKASVEALRRKVRSEERR